jgi:hypothetical protein
MSEIYEVGVVRDLPAVQFRSAGVVYEPSPAPTATLVLEDNSTSALTFTKQGSTTTARYLVEDFTRPAVGQFEVRYATTDSAADIAEFVEYISVVAAVDLDAITDALNLLHTTAEIVSPVREVGGEYEIAIKQGETMSSALGNAIILNFTGVPDTSGCACVLTFTDKNGKLLSSITGNPFTGALGSWSAGAVTATWELTAAATALFPVTKSRKNDLENTIRFEAKLTGFASSGVLKPIMPKVGDVRIFTGVWTG